MLSTRLILWDLQFTAKGYIWPAVKTGRGLIGQYSDVGGDGTGGYGAAIVNIYDNVNSNTVITNIKVQADPLDAEPDDEYGFTEVITEYFTGYEQFNVVTTDTTIIFADSTIFTTDRL
jgi:hypothetical protein